jgi:hypothetical protein
MSDIQNSTNSRRLANEVKLVGNTAPPNMGGVSEDALRAATPNGFNLLNTRTDLTTSDAAAERCRTFTDITGLRNLQKEQANRTYHDAGCGWRYKPSTGIFPEINQAAAGTARGPLAFYSGPGGKDEVSGGTRWFWNLNEAEKEITTKICQSASRCKQLSLLGRYTDICGFCKSSGAMIPIQNTGGKFSARYNDATLGCPDADIVTATTGKCPEETEEKADEGYTGYTRTMRNTRQPGHAGQARHMSRPNTFGSAGGSIAFPAYGRGDLSEAFTVRRNMSVEGFVDLESLTPCMEPPLSRDCVILAARAAGCANEGTLIAALSTTPANSDYDSVLQKNPVYTAYNSVAVPRITSATLKDGSTSLATALDDFGNLMEQTQNTNKKLALSARDLCIRTGEYEAYDFCLEIGPTSIINDTSLPCVKQAWLNNGGTEEGTLYPGDSWKGKTYQSFLTFMDTIKEKINSSSKVKNAKGLLEFIGTESGAPGATVPTNQNTRGAETVWIELGEYTVILRCDLMLTKDKSMLNGEASPYFDDIELASKYKFPSQNSKAYTSAFEIRSRTEQSMKFRVKTDDGFMLSVNQNPFEGTGNKGNDWGSWKFQPPTEYVSGEYPVYAEESGKTNTVVTKWFNGGGNAISQLSIQISPSQTAFTPISEAEIYVTQEPLAPWMQFEVCTRPNDGQGNANGFFEKRFNGVSAARHHTSGHVYDKNFPSFDVNAKSVVIQTDMKKREDVPKKLPYITFTSTSVWSTKSYIHAGAVRTLTILFRPTATLSSSGGTGVVFQHSNGTTFNIKVLIVNNSGTYGIKYIATAFGKDIGGTTGSIKMNEWNLMVIQYVGDNYGLRKMSFHIETLKNLQNPAQLSQFSSELISSQSVSGAVVAGNPRANYIQNSGFFTLGAWDVPSCTGDVAWIHGFRGFLDTEPLLKSEVEQSWLSRWPRGNLDSEIGLKAE